MRLPLRLVLLLGCVIVPNLPASTVSSCGSASFGSPLTPLAESACSMASFSLFPYTETIDWQAAYGTADRALSSVGANFTVTKNPDGTSTAWAANATASGLHVGATLYGSLTNDSPITRLDNFATDPSTSLNNWVGTFGKGDHLLGVQSGMLELQFDRAISGARFRISTTTSSALFATVKAYGSLNPSAGEMPLMTYSISVTESGHDTGLGGYCGPLQYTFGSCDNAPYIGVETGALNIRSLVIFTSDTGVVIDSVIVDAVPEPGTFALTGVVGILATLGRRRMLRGRRS